MSEFRKIDIDYWNDSYIVNLTKDEKFLFLYLLVNPESNQIGIYQMNLKLASFRTDIDIEDIKKHLTKFQKDKKIMYSEVTEEVYIINWLKHNFNKSPLVIDHTTKLLEEVKNYNYKISYINEFNRLAYKHDKSMIINDNGDIDIQDKSNNKPYKTEIEDKEQVQKDNQEDKRKVETNERIEDITQEEEQEEKKEEQKEGDIYTVMNYWNALNIKNIQNIYKLSDSNEKSIKHLIKKYGIKDIKQAIDNIKQSLFLQGQAENGKGWVINFDWILQEKNFIKVLNNTYKSTDEELRKIETLNSVTRGSELRRKLLQEGGLL